MDKKPTECIEMRDVPEPITDNEYTLSPTVDESLMIHDARFFVVLHVITNLGTSMVYQTPEIVIDLTPPSAGKVLSRKVIQVHRIINDPVLNIYNQKAELLDEWDVTDEREINETVARVVFSGFTDREATTMIKYVGKLQTLEDNGGIVETLEIILSREERRLSSKKHFFNFKYQMAHNTRWRGIVTGYSRANRTIDQASETSVVDIEPPVCKHEGENKNPLFYTAEMPRQWHHMLICKDELNREDPDDSGIVQLEIGIGLGRLRDDVVPFTNVPVEVDEQTNRACVLVPPEDMDSEYELCSLTLSEKYELIYLQPYYVSIRIWDRAGNYKVYFSNRVFVSPKEVQAYPSRYMNRITDLNTNPPQNFTSDDVFLRDSSRLPVSFIDAFQDYEAMEKGLGGTSGTNNNAVVKYNYYVDSPDDPKYNIQTCKDNFENGKLANCGTLMAEAYNGPDAVYTITGLNLTENKQYSVCMRATNIPGKVSKWLCTYKEAKLDSRPPKDFNVTMTMSRTGLKGNVQRNRYLTYLTTDNKGVIVDEASGMKNISSCVYETNLTGHVLPNTAEQCNVIGPKRIGDHVDLPANQNNHGRTFIGCFEARDFAGFTRKKCGEPFTVDLTGPEVRIEWVNRPNYITDTSDQFIVKVNWSVNEDYSKIDTAKVCVGHYNGRCDVMEWTELLNSAVESEQTRGEKVLQWNAAHGKKYYVSVEAYNSVGFKKVKSTTKLRCDTQAPETRPYLVEGPQGTNPAFQQITNGVMASWREFIDDRGSGIKNYELQLIARVLADNVDRLEDDMEAYPLDGSDGPCVDTFASNEVTKTPAEFCVVKTVELEHFVTIKFLKHPLLPGTKYYLRLRATDHAEHVSEWVYSDGVIADNTPPECSQLPVWSLDGGRNKPQFTGNDLMELKWSCTDPESKMGSIAVCVMDLQTPDKCVVKYTRQWTETTRIAASNLFMAGPRFSARVSLYNNAFLKQHKLLNFTLDQTPPKCTRESWVSEPSRRRLLLTSGRRSLRIREPIDWTKDTVYISSVDMIRPLIDCVDEETEITLQQVAIGTLPAENEVCDWQELLQKQYTTFDDCNIGPYATYGIYITAKARNALWNSDKNKHMQSLLVSPPFIIDVTNPTVSFGILETNGVALGGNLAFIGASQYELRIKIGAVEDASPFSYFTVCFEQDTNIPYSRYKSDTTVVIKPTNELCQEVNSSHATLDIKDLVPNALTRVKIQAVNAAELKSNWKVINTRVIKDTAPPVCDSVLKHSDDGQRCMVWKAKNCKEDLEGINTYIFELRETNTNTLIKSVESPGEFQRICLKLIDGTNYSVTVKPVDAAGHEGGTRKPYIFVSSSTPPQVTSVTFERVISDGKFSLQAKWSATDKHTKVEGYRVVLHDVQSETIVNGVNLDGNTSNHIFQDINSIEQGKPYVVRVTAFNTLQLRGTSSSEIFVFDNSAPAPTGRKPIGSFAPPPRFYQQDSFKNTKSVTGATIEAEFDSVFFDEETSSLGLTFNWTVVCTADQTVSAFDRDEPVSLVHIHNINTRMYMLRTVPGILLCIDMQLTHHLPVPNACAVSLQRNRENRFC